LEAKRWMTRTLFHLERDEDETGVSGTGAVAEGIVFSNGKVVMSWLTEHTSIAVYENMNHLEAIHGHNGKTRVVIDCVEYRDDSGKRAEVTPVRAGRTYETPEPVDSSPDQSEPEPFYKEGKLVVQHT